MLNKNIKKWEASDFFELLKYLNVYWIRKEFSKSVCIGDSATMMTIFPPNTYLENSRNGRPEMRIDRNMNIFLEDVNTSSVHAHWISSREAI